MAWSDAARRAALEARRRKIRSFLDRKDPKSGVENFYKKENLNRARLLEGRINAKLSGRKQVVRLGLQDYNETSDTFANVTVGPRRRAMKGEVRRQRWNYYVGKEVDNVSLGKLRGSSTRDIAKRARALARSKKPGYHSPYS